MCERREKQEGEKQTETVTVRKPRDAGTVSDFSEC